MKPIWARSMPLPSSTWSRASLAPEGPRARAALPPRAEALPPKVAAPSVAGMRHRRLAQLHPSPWHRLAAWSRRRCSRTYLALSPLPGQDTGSFGSPRLVPVVGVTPCSPVGHRSRCRALPPSIPIWIGRSGSLALLTEVPRPSASPAQRRAGPGPWPRLRPQGKAQSPSPPTWPMAPGEPHLYPAPRALLSVLRPSLAH